MYPVILLQGRAASLRERNWSFFPCTRQVAVNKQPTAPLEKADCDLDAGSWVLVLGLRLAPAPQVYVAQNRPRFRRQRRQCRHMHAIMWRRKATTSTANRVKGEAALVEQICAV